VDERLGLVDTRAVQAARHVELTRQDHVARPQSALQHRFRAGQVRIRSAIRESETATQNLHCGLSREALAFSHMHRSRALTLVRMTSNDRPHTARSRGTTRFDSENPGRWESSMIVGKHKRVAGLWVSIVVLSTAARSSSPPIAQSAQGS
jgi:hypothetical protein